jgi:hypothetical protein
MAPPAGPLLLHAHHREEESFYLLPGTLASQAGEQTFQAPPRDFTHRPERTVNSFRNKGGMHQEVLS